MSLPMVKEPGVPDAKDAKPGMAYFAGTGPAGKTCGDCANRGYYREAVHGHWSEADGAVVYSTYRTQKCTQFKAMTGKHGPDVKSEYAACKYFTQKAK